MQVLYILGEEKAKGRRGRTTKKAEGARGSTNENGEGGILKRLISLDVISLDVTKNSLGRWVQNTYIMQSYVDLQFVRSAHFLSALLVFSEGNTKPLN